MERVPVMIINDVVLFPGMEYRIETNDIKIEEAINKIEQDKTKKELPNKSSNKENYIIKEAEMIINQYISKVENNKRKEVQNKKQKRKYNTLKKWLYITSLISATEFLILLIR